MIELSDLQQQPARRKRAEHLKQFLFYLVFAAGELWTGLFDEKLNKWWSWALIGVSIIFSFNALDALVKLLHRGSEKQASNLASKIGAWILFSPLIAVGLFLSIIAIIEVSDWVKTIPDWAAIIIGLQITMIVLYISNMKSSR